MAFPRNKPKAAHHRGTHQVRAKAITDAARANPLTPCGRCGRTLAQHPRHKTGAPPTWHAGHVIDGMRDGPLRPEVSTCNVQAGARLGNLRSRKTKTKTKLALARRTELTW